MIHHKKKIAICYFSSSDKLEFLNQSLRLLEKTINHHDECDVRIYVYDTKSSTPLKRNQIYNKPTLIRFDKKNNSN
jgi:hypothetical protein